MLRHLKNITFSLTIAIALVFALNFVADNPYTHKVLLTLISDYLREHTNLRFEYDDATIAVVPPSLTFYGVKLGQQGQGAQAQNILTAAKAYARVSIWSLIIGKPGLAVVDLRDPTIVWPPALNVPLMKDMPHAAPEPHADGHMTWPLPDLPLQRVQIANGLIQLALRLPPEKKRGEDKTSDQPRWFKAEMVGVNADIVLNHLRNAHGEWSIDSLSAKQGSTVLAERAKFSMRLRQEGRSTFLEPVNLEETRLRLTSNLTLQFVTGANDHITDLSIHGPVVADGDLTVLASFLELGGVTKGATHADVTLAARFPLEPTTEAPAFSIFGQATVKDGVLSDFALYDAQTALFIDADHIAFDRVSIDHEGERMVEGQGSIEFNEPLDFHFQTSMVHSRLKTILGIFGSTLPALDFDLHAGELAVKGAGFPFNLQVQANAELSDITLPQVHYDQTRYPVSPVCRAAVMVKVDTHSVGFDGTQGWCFQPSQAYEPAAPPKGPVSAPTDLKASDLALSGTIQFEEGPNLRLVSKRLQAALGNHFAQVPLAGDASVVARIHGPNGDVSVDAAVKATGVVANGIPLGAVEGGVLVRNGIVTSRSITAQIDHAKIAVQNGSLNLDDDAFHFAFKGSELTAEQVNAFFRDTLRTKADVHFAVSDIAGKMHGTLFRPESVDADLDLRVTNVVVDAEPILDVAAFHFVRNKGAMDFQKVLLGLNTMRVNGALSIRPPNGKTPAPITGRYYNALGLSGYETFTLTAEGHPIPGEDGNHLGAIPFVGKVLAEHGFKGQFDFKTDLKGTLETYNGTIDGRLRDFRLNEAYVSDVKFRGWVQGSVVDLLFDHSGTAFQGRMKVDLRNPAVPFEWYFNFERFDLRALGPQLFYTDPRNYAYFTGQWHLVGTFADWWDSRGTFALDSLAFKLVHEVKGYDPIEVEGNNLHPTTVMFDGPRGIYVKDNKAIEFGGKNFNARLDLVGDRPPAHLNAKLEGMIDLGILSALSKQIESSSGKIAFSSYLKGSTDQVDYAMHLTNAMDANSQPTPITVNIPSISPAFENIKVDVTLHNGIVTVQQLDAEKGKGHIIGRGMVNLTDPRREASNLSFQLQGIEVDAMLPYIKTLSTVVSGEMNISGRQPPFLLTGDVNIDRARTTRNIDLREEIVQAIRKETLSTTQIGRTKNPWVEIDASITANESIMISNRNMDLALSSHLYLKGTEIKPHLSGTIDINHGRFIYRRVFKITRGQISFDDQVRNDPKLNITAVTQINPYLATINVSGNASDPLVDIQVDPPTRENGTVISKLDALVLISQGKLPDVTEQTSADAKNAGLVEAVSLYASQLPFERLFDLTGQDYIRPYVDYTLDTKGFIAPRINVPLTNAEAIDAKFQYTSERKNVHISLPIHDSISFSGDATTYNDQIPKQDKEQTSIDLKFHFSFK